MSNSYSVYVHIRKEIYENMTEQEKSHRITKALINTRHANTEVSPTK